jgi:hypothetical protein
LLGLLVIAVLLLVVMPVLLYLVGWGVTRYTGKLPVRIGTPSPEQALKSE